MSIILAPGDFVEACRTLRDDPELDLQYLNSLTAVDTMERIEVVIHAQSLARNQMVRIKTVAESYESPEAPSLVSVWWGAQLMERETYDLMGVRFIDNPDLRRIFLWEGFPGHPLRKDYLRVPGGDPGWPYFPGEPNKQGTPAHGQPWTQELSGAPATHGEDPRDVRKHDDIMRNITDDLERTSFGDPG